VSCGGQSSRLIARDLAGYLCGTRSGLHARRRPAPGPEAIARAHRCVPPPRFATSVPAGVVLGSERWQATDETQTLFDRLSASLAGPEIVELVVFGSQARGGTTGFSDLDAVLVIRDDVADDAAALRAVRSRVLAAQRAVLAFQPMQHHAFEVATPRLLADASAALALPRQALTETRSLLGNGATACLDGPGTDADDALRALATGLGGLPAWPRHPWLVHRLVATFELVPAVYLQATGRPFSKAASFEIARADFPQLWRPYDVLYEVRRRWPRLRSPDLRLAIAAFRNPWSALAFWRRLPYVPPQSVASLLDARCLSELQVLVRSMVEEASAA
jgi:hypothetical protein